MSYTISWRPSAQARLTEIWLAARDRERINDAIKSLEEALHRDPHLVGESRELNHRVVFIDALMIKLLVDDLRQSVQIRSIRRIR